MLTNPAVQAGSANRGSVKQGNWTPGPVTLANPKFSFQESRVRQRSSLLQSMACIRGAKQIGCEASLELSLPTEMKHLIFLS